MTALRIGVDIRPLLHPATGIGRYTRTLLEQLLESDHQWFLYCDRHYKSELTDSPNVTVRCSQRKATSILNLWTSQILFSHWAKQDKLDVFWSPRHHLPLHLPATIKTVVTVHDMVWRRFPETMKTKNLWLERLLMPAALKRTDKLIAVSKFTAAELADFYPMYGGKLEVVPAAAFKSLPADQGEASRRGVAGRDLPEQYFLFVGTNEPRKNLGLLLKVYRSLSQKLNVGLVLVAGRGWGQPSIEKQLQYYNLNDSVLHYENLEDAALDTLYRRARVLILPALYEGFGLPVLESMSRGVPVIVSDRGPLPEIVGDGGVIIDPESVPSLQKAMTRLAEDDALHSELSSEAEQRAKNFSWERAAEQTLEILESVIH